MEPGGIAAVAVVTYPDAVVLVVYTDGLGVPVGEVGQGVGAQKLAAVTVEQIQRVGQVLRLVLVGIGVEDPEVVAYGIVAQVTNLGDSGGDVAEALLPEHGAVQLVFEQACAGLGAEIQVALVPGNPQRLPP